jgi:hypothetical protein
MRATRAAARVLPLAAWALLGAAAAPTCELVLSEHRSQRELLRLPLDTALPTAQVAFTHSVLGTPVSDRYVWRQDAGQWRAHLVEERFEGDGYGLPNAAAAGETLVRVGDGWRLQLDRVVHPLVVLPLPAQHMRVIVAGREALPLAALSTKSVQFGVDGCASH